MTDDSHELRLEQAALQRIGHEAQALSDAWREHYRGEVEALKAVMKVGAENLIAARRAISMLRDETDPVIAEAERLTQGALGDTHLWAATQPLREALKKCPTRLDASGNLWRTGGDA